MDHSFVDTASAPDGYTLSEGTPSPAAFVRLREEAGMGSRSLEASKQGLPNTLFAVHTRDSNGDAVGVARVVGDGGTVFHISDVAVAEAHQGRGLGTAMMDAVMAYIKQTAPETAYVNLLADVDGLYDRWNFEYSAPDSKGMVWKPDK